MGEAFANKGMQSPLGPLSIHPLLECPGSSPWELIFHTVLLAMDLSHIVCQGFKGETTKRAGIARETQAASPGRLLKTSFFLHFKIEETGVEIPNFT